MFSIPSIIVCDKSHFSGSTIKKDVNSGKLSGGTTLQSHMYHDKTLGEEFGFNFSIPNESINLT